MDATRRNFLLQFAGVFATTPWQADGIESPSTGDAHHAPTSMAVSQRRPRAPHSAGCDSSSMPCQSAANHADSPYPATTSPRFSAATADPSWLEAWLRLPRVPLGRAPFPQLGTNRLHAWQTATLISQHIELGSQLGLIYEGGSEPHAWRNVLPVHLFTVPTHGDQPNLTNDPIYLLAYCLKRRAARIFRLDRITSCEPSHFPLANTSHIG